MTKEDLIKIEKEIERFSKFLKEARKKSDENTGYEIQGKLYNIGSISGFKESGQLKRAALDLKRILTQYAK